jgi:hypothetical protein
MLEKMLETDNAGEPSTLAPQFLRWIAATARCKTAIQNKAITTSLNQTKH